MYTVGVKRSVLAMLRHETARAASRVVVRGLQPGSEGRLPVTTWRRAGEQQARQQEGETSCSPRCSRASFGCARAERVRTFANTPSRETRRTKTPDTRRCQSRGRTAQAPGSPRSGHPRQSAKASKSIAGTRGQRTGAAHADLDGFLQQVLRPTVEEIAAADRSVRTPSVVARSSRAPVPAVPGRVAHLWR